MENSQASSDRISPHDLQAEQSLLGSIFLGGYVEVLPTDFTRAAHVVICEAIADLRQDGTPIDTVTVADYLDAKGLLSEAGGKPYLLDIAGMVPTSANVKHYAEIVQRHAKSRRLIALGTRLVAEGFDGVDPEEAAGNAMTDLSQMADTGRKRSMSLAAAVYRRLRDYLTPLEFVLFPGTRARAHFGDVTIIAGEQGAGKSAFALIAAPLIWYKRYKTLLLTYEMSGAELADRFISNAVKQPSDFAHDGLSQSELATYEEACADLLADKNIVIKESAGMTPGQLVQTIRVFAANGGRIAVIDYAQIAHGDTDVNENASIARLLRALQQVAKATGVAVILLSQYNRDIQGKPKIRNLRGSGTLGQEAANVLLMWTPDPEDTIDAKYELKATGYEFDCEGPEYLVRIEWAKRRHGAKGSTDWYLFDGATMTFTPIDREAR